MNFAATLAQMIYRTPDAAQYLTGGVGAVLAVVFLILAALWIIFPFMVYSKFNELIRATKRNGETLEEIERNTRKPTDPAHRSERYSLDDGTSPYVFALALLAALAAVVLAVFLLRQR